MGYDESFSDGFEKEYMALLTELAISRDFLTRLKEDDDWSFVIKIHALIEVAISHLLTEHFGGELGSIFARLDMNNKEYGKMKFVKVLSLLEKNQTDFIDLLTEMRNAFAHDIRMTSSGIDSYLIQLKDDEKRKDRYNKWMKLFTINESNQLLEEMLLKATRPFIMLHTTLTLTMIYHAKEKAKILRDRKVIEAFYDIVEKTRSF